MYIYASDVELKQVAAHTENGAIYDLVVFKEDLPVAEEVEPIQAVYLAAGINAMLKVY